MNNSLLYELSDEIVRNKSKRIKFKACGSSMRPFVKDGDIVEIEPIKEFESINKGDILLFSRGNAVCLHRAIRLNGSNFTIKGDSSRYIDGKIDKEDIIGKLLSIERNGHQIEINNSWLNKIAPFSWIWYRFIFIIKKLLKPILKPIHGYFLSILPVRSTLRNCFRNRIKTSLAEPSDAYDICMFYQQFDNEQIKNTKKAILDKESYYVIVKLLGRIIGITSLHYDERQEPWNGWWLTGLQVMSIYKGIGAGQAIVNLAIQKVKEMDGNSLKLFAFKGRKPANSLYEKLGFKRIIDSEIEQSLEDEAKTGNPRRIYMVKNIL